VWQLVRVVRTCHEHICKLDNRIVYNLDNTLWMSLWDISYFPSKCARIKCEISRKLMIFRLFYFNICICKIIREIILRKEKSLSLSLSTPLTRVCIVIWIDRASLCAWAVAKNRCGWKMHRCHMVDAHKWKPMTSVCARFSMSRDQ